MSDQENETSTTSTGQPKAVKLPYFHRTLSPQDAALIGDITPKPIGVSGSGSSSKTESASVSGKVNESSAWNAANTWEERDYTSQAKAKLLAAFSADESVSGVAVRKIDKVEGHASITHVRGRARFMYEWSFSLDFEASGAQGTAEVSDVMNDQLDDIEIEVKWKGAAPARDAAKAIKESLKKEVIRRVKTFEEYFRQV